jgi:Bacterial DNA-binding protein
VLAQFAPQALLRQRSSEETNAVCGSGTRPGAVWTALLRREAPMTKADLVTTMATDAEITQRQARKAGDALVGSVQEALSQDDRIHWRDLARSKG